MNSILSNSIQSLKKCYKGTDETGSHIIDKSEMDDLAFIMAITQVNMAIKKGTLTEEKFIDLLSAGSEEPMSWGTDEDILYAEDIRRSDRSMKIALVTALIVAFVVALSIFTAKMTNKTLKKNKVLACQEQLEINKRINTAFDRGEEIAGSYSICNLDAYTSPCPCFGMKRGKK